MPWWYSISDKYYQRVMDGHWKPYIDESDCRKSFAVKYMEMKTRFQLRRLLLPVTFPDSCSLLFSDLPYERKFMVRMWCLLDIYSQDEFVDGGDYPLQYTRENGPVPIQIAANSDTYHRSSGPAPASCGKGFEYTWTDDKYRFAILGLRAIGAKPQYHVASHKKAEHGSCRFPKSKTCGELLPSIFLGQGISGRHETWDADEFGCTGCEAHAVIFTYIALAEQDKLGNGGLSVDTMKPSKVPDMLKSLDTRRYKFEDFWRLISQARPQMQGNQDSANAWGTTKLNRLDYESNRKWFWYDHSKVKKIEELSASFIEERERRITEERGNGGGISAGDHDDETERGDLDQENDSDDDIVTLWDSQASQKSTPILSSTQGTSASGRAQKRQIVHVDSDSDESEDDAFKKFKRTMEGFRR